jgi:hypothetical protein
MNSKTYPHPLLVLLIALIASLALGSCSADWHLRQAVKKGANVYIQKWDTTIVTKERKIVDTVLLPKWDSVVINKNNIKVKLVRRVDTIRVSATCASDTVQVTKYIRQKVSVPRKESFFWQVVIIIGLLVGLTALIKR